MVQDHVNQNPNYAELLDDICDLVLKKIDPLQKEAVITKSTEVLGTLGELNKRSRHIPNHIRKIVLFLIRNI